MARLRIGIMADQAPPPDPREGSPSDIVFSQDVIARHARLEWYPVDARPIAIDDLIPSQWSRRMPAAKDDMKSVVYLCCPAQTVEGWSYLGQSQAFFVGTGPRPVLSDCFRRASSISKTPRWPRFSRKPTGWATGLSIMMSSLIAGSY